MCSVRLSQTEHICGRLWLQFATLEASADVVGKPGPFVLSPRQQTQSPQVWMGLVLRPELPSGLISKEGCEFLAEVSPELLLWGSG